ncbi:MAG TPA: transketolase C-terminal domain-containing protein, partial [Candidatus Saccharimonadales bacterium]|nr:transketolase C-terminal domain-containing protein [Candidatus Saccharimonadales bacterium]
GSDQHDERGLYNEESENRVKMMDKRFKKLDMAAPEIPPLAMYGPLAAPLTIVAFGSTKMPILDAMSRLSKEGVNVNFLQVHALNPFPNDKVAQVLKAAKKTLVIENNKLGQFEGLIREHTGLSVNEHFRKYDGRPFYPEEIVAKVKSLVTV